MSIQKKEYLRNIIFLTIALALSLQMAYADYDDPEFSCEIENEPDYSQGALGDKIVDHSIPDNFEYDMPTITPPAFDDPKQPAVIQTYNDDLFCPQLAENDRGFDLMEDMPIITAPSQFEDKFINNPEDPNLLQNPTIDNMPIIDSLPPLDPPDFTRDLETTEYDAMPDNQLWAYNEHNATDMPDTIEEIMNIQPSLNDIHGNPVEYFQTENIR